VACERVKPTIRNIVVFVTIYICTNNFLLLFDNTTGMTHLKIIINSFFSIYDLRYPHIMLI